LTCIGVLVLAVTAVFVVGHGEARSPPPPLNNLPFCCLISINPCPLALFSSLDFIFNICIYQLTEVSMLINRLEVNLILRLFLYLVFLNKLPYRPLILMFESNALGTDSDLFHMFCFQKSISSPQFSLCTSVLSANIT
jgi:hypothetical protein